MGTCQAPRLNRFNPCSRQSLPGTYGHATSSRALSIPRLGVRIYKKVVPSSGEWVSRLRGIDRLKLATTGSRRVALQNYAAQTRKWELRHLASAVLLQAWAFIGGATIGVEQFWWSSAINLLVNIYPIMVQRFNRARIALMLQHEPRPRWIQ
jgi:hypothetical protein